MERGCHITMKLTCRALTQTVVNLAIRPLNYIRSIGHRGKRSMCSVWLCETPVKETKPQNWISFLKECGFNEKEIKELRDHFSQLIEVQE